MNERGAYLHSPSSCSSGSLGLTLVVEMVALGSASMICLPFYGSDSNSKPASDSKAFTSATNNFFEMHLAVLFQGLLWNSHHFLMSLFIFPLSFFVYSLD
jgi:hypothetical protein